MKPSKGSFLGKSLHHTSSSDQAGVLRQTGPDDLAGVGEMNRRGWTAAEAEEERAVEAWRGESGRHSHPIDDSNDAADVDDRCWPSSDGALSGDWGVSRTDDFGRLDGDC